MPYDPRYHSVSLAFSITQDKCSVCSSCSTNRVLKSTALSRTFHQEAMDEECGCSVLLIDLDDEKEEKQDVEINIDDEKGTINDNNENNYTPIRSNEGTQKYSRKNQISGATTNQNDNSDDDIVVIDDDDDYENSVQRLVNVAHAVKRHVMYDQYYTNYLTNDISCLSSLNANQNKLSKDDSRNRVGCRVEGNTNMVRPAYDSDIYQAHYVMNDYAPYFVDKAFTQKEHEPYRREGSHVYRYADIHKPETLSMDEYNAAINRYTHNYVHRSELNSNNDYYRDTSKDTYRYIYRPELLNANDYRHPINRDTNIHAYGPEVALGKNDYTSSYNEIYKDVYDHVYVPVDVAKDGFNYSAMNKVLYNPIHRPEIAFSNDTYRDANMRDAYTHSQQPKGIMRDGYSYTHRPEEMLMNDDCRYRCAITNRFPDSLAYEDDYWHTRRHVYRPEAINIDDYRRAEISRNYSYGNMPNLDRCRSGLDYHYRPNFINFSTLESMLSRYTYPESGMYYMPEARYMDGYRPHEDDYRNDEAILNLSRIQKSTNVNNRHESGDGSKLRTILCSRNYIINSEDQKMHMNKQRKTESYRTSTDIIKNSDSVRTNKPEVHMNISKSKVPFRENRSTVILNTNDVCRNVTNNNHDVIAPTNKMHDRYEDTCHTANKVIKKNESLANIKSDVMHDKNEIREGNSNNVVIDRNINKAKPDNIRFLAVFFTRVKNLVNEIFPEFSKSLEREIESLGEMATNGIVKTEINFICPLYCSVSTYSLPRFDDIKDDNKIEKHNNHSQICDMCSCIQNSYTLYKKKYFYLLSTSINEKQEDNYRRGRKRKITAQFIGSRNKGQPVKAYDKLIYNDDLQNTKTSHRNPVSISTEGNSHKAYHQQNTDEQTEIDIKINLPRLNENSLLDSKAILNFNVHGNNVDEPINYKIIDKDIESFQKRASNVNTKIEESTVFKNTVTCSQPREAKVNLICSLPQDTKSNFDIPSNVNNKSDRKLDEEFTCHICSCIFTDFPTFVSHLQKEHDINSNDEEPVRCPFCGIYSKQKHHNDHVKKSHPQIFTHKGEASGIQMKVDKRHKKRKFIFTCLVCHKNLKSREVKRHREKEHKGLTVAKMFTKKLSILD